MEIPEEIIEGCRNNQRKAQEWLYKKLFSYMMGICYRYFQNREVSREIVNDAYMKILRHISDYDRTCSFKSWISRITVNTVIDYIRKDRKWKNTIQTGNHEFSAIDEYETLSYSYNDAIQKMELKDLYKLFDCLSDKEKTIFNLFAIDGYSHREIAHELKISEELSRWYVKCAREKLKKLILDYYKKINISIYQDGKR